MCSNMNWSSSVMGQVCRNTHQRPHTHLSSWLRITSGVHSHTTALSNTLPETTGIQGTWEGYHLNTKLTLTNMSHTLTYNIQAHFTRHINHSVMRCNIIQISEVKLFLRDYQCTCRQPDQQQVFHGFQTSPSFATNRLHTVFLSMSHHQAWFFSVLSLAFKLYCFSSRAISLHCFWATAIYI